MIRTFRSPRSRSLSAATAPGRLAREFDGALWRERPDGGLEVATMHDRRIERYLVHDDGTTTHVASQEPTSVERYAAKLALASWGFCIAGIAAGGSGSETAGVALFLVGFALFAFFGVRSANAEDLAARVKKWEPGDWHEPTNLHEWTPRTTEQLAAVERIADEHDGLAFVRDNGSRTIDVCAADRGRMEIFWVDELGRSDLAKVESRARNYYAGRVLQGAAMLLWLAILAVVFVVPYHKVLLLGLLGGSLATVMFVVFRNEKSVSVEEHVKTLARDGQPWIEIRTRLVEDDGD